ncbi:membrane-bound protein conserved in bacteria [Lapidilactobacillus concavus DSM 17758]|uniref:Membrane-bound protein conserved in bacteria n=1 Tax=Lapidilactobacillus concavus DSM 17758 TaxID=1423735 RepID=A0A0R1VXM3_9LACO|nr:DUF1129 family protein [Lapidilactobacillus concavus]KRM10440.1 membrane-bound protein conserved in bacteria [Lapidilactobacillus concavus DSM 17758]MCH4056382.1 DUF1129 domain-containing protein [Lactobacillaceae bacterium]GEL12791.1 membrane protein [Lapidilactobacillus concavus]
MASTEERNQEASEQQAQKIAEQEQNQAEIATMSAAELRTELSHKNNDYIFKLHKLLVEGGYADADANTKIDALLPEIIQNQRIGKPATQLYGSASFKYDQMIHAKAKPKKVKYWMRSLDMSFLYLVILSVLFGVMGLIPGKKNTTSQSSGIVTLIIMAIAFGFLLTWFTDTMEASRNRKKEEKHRFNWGTIGKVSLATIGVLLLISLTALVNPAINPVLPAWGYLILAAASYGARYLFRLHYHITGRTI